LMMVCVGRVLRLSLAVAVVSGFGLAATSASAQVVDATLVCADPNDVISNFGDLFNWAAFEDGNCDKLCKSYSNKCKAFIKNNASCIKKAIQDDAELEKKAVCEPITDKTERKDCKDSVKADENADLDDAKAEKEAGLDACEVVQSDCVDICVNGVPIE